MNIKERIQQYLDYKGIKTNSFEKEVGLSNGYWRKTKSISANAVSEILGIYSDLSAEWVFRGEGSMLRKQDIALMLDDAIKDSTFLDDRLDKVIEKKVNEAIQKHFNKEA